MDVLVRATAYEPPPGKIGKGGGVMGYAMTKAAFARVARLLEVELGDQDISTFSVGSGLVPTERTEATNRSGDDALRGQAPPSVESAAGPTTRGRHGGREGVRRFIDPSRGERFSLGRWTILRGG